MGISPQGNYPPQGQKYPQKHHHGKGTRNSSDLVEHIHIQVMHNNQVMLNNLFLEDNNYLILLMNMV